MDNIYYQRYIKYKLKYLLLKGGNPPPSPQKLTLTLPPLTRPLDTPISSSSIDISAYPIKLANPDIIIKSDITIPSEIITYDNIILPHNIPMYKEMVRLYLSLFIKFEGFNKATYGIIDKDNNHITYNPEIARTYQIYSSDTSSIIKRMFEKNYPPFYLNDENDGILETFSLENLKYQFEFIPNSLIMDCFFTGCNKGIHPKSKIMICRNKDLLICGFSVGKTYKQSDPINNIDNIKQFLQFIKTIITSEKKVKQLLLLGHSNGMNAATFTAFILQYIKNKDTYQANYPDLISKLPTLLDEITPEILDELNKIEIFIVGSGGSPMLFKTEDEFKFFYNSLGGKYLHISSGRNPLFYYKIMPEIPKREDRIYIDHFLKEYENDGVLFKNYKFVVYSSANGKFSSKCDGYSISLPGYKYISDEIADDEDNKEIIIDERTAYHEFPNYLILLTPFFYRI